MFLGKNKEYSEKESNVAWEAVNLFCIPLHLCHRSNNKAEPTSLANCSVKPQVSSDPRRCVPHGSAADFRWVSDFTLKKSPPKDLNCSSNLF